MNINTKVIVSGVSGLVLGGVLGFVVTQRVLSAKYAEIAQTEIDSVKDHYKLIRDTSNRVEDILVRGTLSEMDEHTITKAVNQTLRVQLGYSTPEDEEDVIDEEPSASEVRPERESRKMTIEEAEDINTLDPEFQQMLESRSDSEPYILTVDEFMENDLSHVTESLVYYEGDDTLVDEREQVIPEVGELIGHDALTKFGKYSKDKNIVYVRNVRKEMDFEIARDERSYIEAVAGFRPSKTVLKKMREDD